MFLKTWEKTAGINRSNYSKEKNTVKNLRKITIKTSSHATTSLTTPYKYKKRKADTMNTIQDKSKASMGKVQDISTAIPKVPTKIQLKANAASEANASVKPWRRAVLCLSPTEP